MSFDVEKEAEEFCRNNRLAPGGTARQDLGPLLTCAIEAERERVLALDFIRIIWGAAKRTKISQRLALYHLHEMSKDIAAAIREEPSDELS